MFAKSQNPSDILKIRLTLFTYLVMLFILTWSPFEFSTRYFVRLMDYDHRRLFFYLSHFRILDVLGNIVMFLPFGVLLRKLKPEFQSKSKKQIIWYMVLTGALTSIVIEGGQLFLRRSTSFMDITFNVLGTILGYFGSTPKGWVTRLGKVFLAWWQRGWRHLLSIGIYMCLLGFIFYNPTTLNHLGTWKARYPLLLGNEGTGNRPWEGELAQVAIYDRALSPSEVQSSYLDGPDISPGFNPIVYYEFNEPSTDIVHDLSQFDEPLNLFGQEVQKTNGRVRFSDNHFLRSRQSCKKIVHRVNQTHQFSVAIWMRSDNLIQTGPTRIVSFSRDTDSRNFTLGQQGRGLHFRVRTPMTGPNGSQVYLRANNVLRDTTLHHVVATFHHGVQRLFVDGKPARSTVRGDLDYAPQAFRLGKNVMAKIGFCFVLFCPWGFILHRIFRKHREVLTLLTTGGLIVIQQILFHLLFGQSFGWMLLFTALVSTTWGAIISRVWEAYPTLQQDNG